MAKGSKLEIYGNSMGYKVSVEDEDLSFSRLKIPTETLDIAQEVNISGGNVTINFPKDTEYTVELRGEKGIVITQSG